MEGRHPGEVEPPLATAPADGGEPSTTASEISDPGSHLRTASEASGVEQLDASQSDSLEALRRMDVGRPPLESLLQQKQELVQKQSAAQLQLQRIDSLSNQLAQAGLADTPLPQVQLEREHLFVLHRHILGVVNGCISTLADVDFNEAEILLGGQPPDSRGGDASSALDMAVAVMMAQVQQLGIALSEAPPSVHPFLHPALEHLHAIAQPRPAHISRLAGAARLHLDLRFAHVNLGRLAIIADDMNMRLITALRLEAILREHR